MCPNKTAVLLQKKAVLPPFCITEFSALRGSVDQGFASGLFAGSFNLLKNLLAAISMHRCTSRQNIGLNYARSQSRFEAKASRWILGVTRFSNALSNILKPRCSLRQKSSTLVF